MAMIALAGVLVGEFSRRGYLRRLMIASAVALVVRLIALAASAAAVDEPALNAVQYALPVLVMLIAGGMMEGRRSRKKRLDSGPMFLARA